MADATHEASTGIPQRKRAGRKAKVTLMTQDVIFAIRYTYLTDPNATMSQLSHQFHVGLHVIAQLLNGPEYESIREQVHKTTTQSVRDRLHAASELASQKWVESFTPAAKKGDHRPMRDLLQANRVIDVTQGITPPVVIQIGVQAQTLTVTPQLPQTTPPSPDTTPDLPSVTPPTGTTTPPPALPPGADPPAPLPPSTPGTTGGKRRRGKGAGK